MEYSKSIQNIHWNFWYVLFGAAGICQKLLSIGGVAVAVYIHCKSFYSSSDGTLLALLYLGYTHLSLSHLPHLSSLHRHRGIQKMSQGLCSSSIGHLARSVYKLYTGDYSTKPPITKPPINGCPRDSGGCHSVTQTCPNASEAHLMQ
jgi:hypothetical protein